MRQAESLILKGRWRLTATEKGTRKLGRVGELYIPERRFLFRGRPLIDVGHIVHCDEGSNIVVTDGLEFISNMLIDTSAVYDTGLTYCAEGTDNTAPAANQEDLVTEAARKAITSRTISGVESTFSTFFTAAEANDVIAEAGLFGGSGASAAADSGIMFCRWLVSFDNSGALYDITFDYVLTPSYS